MGTSSYKVVRLTQEYAPKSFNCGDQDLNEFLLDNAKAYLKELLAVTYILESTEKNEIIAFFSILNDKIAISDFPSKRKYWAFAQKLKNKGKCFNSYPSMKIGRFAINQPYQHQGFGQIVIDILKQSFTQNNRTGCKYLTVDAYRSATPFYEKNGFKYLSESDKDAETRLMYFDLIQLMED